MPPKKPDVPDTREFIAKVGFDIATPIKGGPDRVEAGQTVKAKHIPKGSIDWMVEQDVIEEVVTDGS